MNKKTQTIKFIKYNNLKKYKTIFNKFKFTILLI